jgi:hypothetical protein
MKIGKDVAGVVGRGGAPGVKEFLENPEVSGARRAHPEGCAV